MKAASRAATLLAAMAVTMVRGNGGGFVAGAGERALAFATAQCQKRHVD